MKKKSLSLYERFHNRMKLQKKVIGVKNFTYRDLIQVLEKYVKNEDKILDIGCGAGTIDFFLANKGLKVTGIDISVKAVEMCKKNSHELGFDSKLKFEKINFPIHSIVEKFNLIICSEVLEHLKDDKVALKEIYKLLFTGGITIFSVPSKNAPLYKLGLANIFDNKVGHLRRYTQLELKDLINDAGFDILEIIKTEGMLRNVLFLNSILGKTIKILNEIEFLSDIITYFDNLIIPLFGESNIFILAKKK